MKKIAVVFIISFILALGLFLGVQYYLNIRAQKGALQVTSSPQSKVYLNGSYLGQTPLCKCQATDMVTPGDYTISLVPLDSSLQEFQEKVTISEGVLTVVDRKFGLNGQSEGSIISLSPLADNSAAQLEVVSFPQGANVLLDDQNIGTTPVFYHNPTESDHDLKISKEGYNEKEIRIRTPLGYKLTVAAYLSTSTTSLDAAPTTAATPTPSTEASTSPIPTPTVTNSVVILNTPTGYLWVREGPSVSAGQITQVKPGAKYPLISEENNWYEITLSDGTTGWVSGQYAKKQ
ncbi:MAG TPA: PEGA domain-containing protein [Candidatus Acidoferrales bacterium]|nr:PEGA domain-containing protein [Candidatus Acidoferrales bacterium]